MAKSTENDGAPPTRTLGPFRFATDGIPGNEQFDAWRENVRAIADISPRRGDRASCPVVMTSWDLGDFVFCRDRNPGAFFQRTRRRVRSAAADHWYLFLIESGATWMASDGRPAGGERISQGRAGQLAFYSLAEACHGEMASIDTRMLFIPRDLFPGLADAFDRASNTMLDTPLGGLLADYLLSLERRLPELVGADLPNLSVSIQSMVAACLVPSAEHAEAAEPALLVVRRERAASLIRDRLSDPRLTPAAVARALGLSRSEIYRLFEGQGGVAHYIRMCRLAAAHDALSDPGETRRVHQIAEAFGFADGQSFSRAFHRHFGYRPSEIRHVVSPRPPSADPALAERTDSPTLDALLRAL